MVRNSLKRIIKRNLALDCNYQWTEHHTHRGRPLAERALAVFLYCHGLSMNAIAKILRASPSTDSPVDTVYFANQHLQPPEPATDAVVLELDEMWHYLKKKSRNSVESRDELIECGHRDKATLKKLIQRLEKWNVKVYYTDDWHPLPSRDPQR